MKQVSVVRGLFLSILLIFGGVAPSSAIEKKCDRACLEGYVNQYLQALIANKPDSLPLSKDVRFTENTIQLNLTQGLWASADSLGPFKIYISDPKTQQAAYMGVVIENGQPSLLAVRLRIKNGEIKDIETIVARKGMTTLGPSEDAATRIAHPMFAEALKFTEKISRLEMIAAANQYFEGIEQNSGDIVPFDETCNREENGIQTANIAFMEGPVMNCKEQFNSGFMFWTLPERRFWMVDEERGLVIGTFVFRSELPKKPVENNGMPGPLLAHNAIVELFKIKNGRIYEIDAILGPMLPYGQKTGW